MLLAALLHAATALPRPLTHLAKSLVECRSHHPPTDAAMAQATDADISAAVDHLRRAHEHQRAIDLLRAATNLGRAPYRQSYDALAAALTKLDQLDDALEVLSALHAAEKRANPTNYRSILRKLAALGRADEAFQLLRDMSEAGVAPDARAHAEVLTELLRSGDSASAAAHASALHQSSKPPARDLPLFNVMLQSLLKEGRATEASELLGELRAAGLEPSARTLNILLTSFTSRGRLPEALEVFNSYCAAGGSPGTVSYNVLISAFARRGELVNCENLLRQMRAGGAAADRYTYNGLLRACVGARAPRRATMFYRIMRRAGVLADASTFTLLALALAPAGRGARVVSYAREWLGGDDGLGDDVRALDVAACATLLRSCAEAAPEELGLARDEAYWVWGYMSSQRLEPTDAARAWMVRSLGAAGDLAGARAVFEEIPPPRGRGTWNAMLRVCNECGDHAAASELLREGLEGGSGAMEAIEL